MDKFELNKQITMAKCMTVFDSDRLENELTETSIVIHACMLIRQFGSNEAEKNFLFEQMEEDDSSRGSDSQVFFRPKMIWLRKHYPLYLGCASLNKYAGDTAKIQDEIWKCREAEISVLTPDINHSASACMPEGGKIRMGLASICGLSQSSTEHMIQVRDSLRLSQSQKTYSSFKAFLLHIDLAIVTEIEIELLIKAGAFRSMLNNPAATIDSLACLIKEVKQSSYEIVQKTTSQASTKQEELQAEYEALGCYISEHPLIFYMPSFFKNNFEQIDNSPEWEGHTLFGRVASISELTAVNASGESTFASIMFDDPFGRTNVLVTSEVYPSVQEAIQLNNLLLIEVQAYRFAGETSYLLTNAYKLERQLPKVESENFHFGYVKYQAEKQLAESIITTTVKHINQQSNAFGMDAFNPTMIPLDDAETYNNLTLHNNPFELLSPEDNSLLKALKPNNFEDLLIAVRLSSPVFFMVGITDDYLACARGEKEPSFLIPELKPLLESTYGILIFQESLQDIVEHVAGFSPTESKAFHRALCKKKPSDLISMRAQLKQGLGNLMTEDEADNLFDWLEYHAGMLIKKSALAKSVLTGYQQAWLKTHHTEAYSLAATEQQPTTIRVGS